MTQTNRNAQSYNTKPIENNKNEVPIAHQEDTTYYHEALTVESELQQTFHTKTCEMP